MCLKFFQTNMKRILQEEKSESLINHPHLMFDILREITKDKKNDVIVVNLWPGDIVLTKQP